MHTKYLPMFLVSPAYLRFWSWSTIKYDSFFYKLLYLSIEVFHLVSQHLVGLQHGSLDFGNTRALQTQNEVNEPKTVQLSQSDF